MEKEDYIEGFRVTYCSDNKRTCLDVPPEIKLTSQEKLEATAQKIIESWVHGSYRKNGIRQDFYFHDGDFAEIMTDTTSKDIHVVCIQFVNATSSGLEKTIRGFNLPYTRKM